MCAIRVTDNENGIEILGDQLDVYNYSTCDTKKYSDISSTGNFKVYQLKSDACPSEANSAYQIVYEETKVVSGQDSSTVTCSFDRYLQADGLAKFYQGEVLNYRHGFNVYPSVVA